MVVGVGVVVVVVGVVIGCYYQASIHDHCSRCFFFIFEINLQKEKKKNNFKNLNNINTS